MLKIRLRRCGKKKQPIFRIVVAEHTMPVKGKFIEILGFYNPRTKEKGLKKERIKYWLEKGAYPSDTVAMLLRGEGLPLPSELQKPKKYVRVRKKKEKTESQKGKEGKGEEGKVASEEKTSQESSTPSSDNSKNDS